MNFAIEYALVESVRKLRYSCERCRNINIVEYATVRVHLFKRGFMPNYYYWTSHGEVAPPTNQFFYGGETSVSGGMHGGQNTGGFAWNDDNDHVRRYETIVRDSGGVGCSCSGEQQSTEEIPNIEAARFYKMLNQAQEPLWDDCDTLTALSSVVQLMSLKFDHNMFQEYFNDLCLYLNKALSRGHKNVDDYYR